MKFWELTSAFRDESNILWEVLSRDKWTNYYKQYRKLDEIIKDQERDILDEELPFELCYEIAEKSKQEFWLSFDEQPQVVYNYRPNIAELERLLPSEILIRFGGDKIEDARERSSTNVQPRPLHGNVEVIGSYNMNSSGLLLILRTEKDSLADNCILSTLEETKHWKVKNEIRNLFIDPYSAYEKVEAQNKQNIKQYLLTSIDNKDKPKPGELLKIAQEPS